MQAHRMHVTVPEDRRTIIEFPDTVPAGQIELIVLIPAQRDEAPGKASQEALRRWDAVAAEVALDRRPLRELPPEERQARLRKLRGIGKGLLPSSEEFLRQKREEIQLEERKQRLRHKVVGAKEPPARGNCPAVSVAAGPVDVLKNKPPGSTSLEIGGEGRGESSGGRPHALLSGLPPEPPVSECVDTDSQKARTPRWADGGGLGLGGRPS
jgi:hypothetical protein